MVHTSLSLTATGQLKMIQNTGGRTQGGVSAMKAAAKDLYQVQETLKKLCEFSTVWEDWADLGSTKSAEQKLKYATFEGGFFNFSGAKKALIFLKIFQGLH